MRQSLKFSLRELVVFILCVGLGCGFIVERNKNVRLSRLVENWKTDAERWEKIAIDLGYRNEFRLDPSLFKGNLENVRKARPTTPGQ